MQIKKDCFEHASFLFGSVVTCSLVLLASTPKAQLTMNEWANEIKTATLNTALGSKLDFAFGAETHGSAHLPWASQVELDTAALEPSDLTKDVETSLCLDPEQVENAQKLAAELKLKPTFRLCKDEFARKTLQASREWAPGSVFAILENAQPQIFETVVLRTEAPLEILADAIDSTESATGGNLDASVEQLDESEMRSDEILTELCQADQKPSNAFASAANRLLCEAVGANETSDFPFIAGR